MTEEKRYIINNLRSVFRISTAALDFAHIVTTELGTKKGLDPKATQMKGLHDECLKELEKIDPDLDRVNAILLQMEILASQPLPPKKFKKGGI